MMYGLSRSLISVIVSTDIAFAKQNLSVDLKPKTKYSKVGSLGNRE